MVIENALNCLYSYFCRCENGEVNSKYTEKSISQACDEMITISRLEKHEFSLEQSKGVDGYDSVQNIFAKINEKESIRKSKGVYYTPNDVVDFILQNSIKSSLRELTPDNLCSGLSETSIEQFCFGKTIYDPTCGAGEFLLAALNLKLDYLENSGKAINKRSIAKVVGTIFGNDVNEESVIITKLRLYVCVVKRFGTEKCCGLGEKLNTQFTTQDYVAPKSALPGRFDIIVGNPPYVEDSKSGLDLKNRYGNIYANVLHNATMMLKPGGTIGFVIPLSYISTPRMKKLRDELMDTVSEQYILSFADRPDCLFDSVHQKLCILIGNKDQTRKPVIFTGHYTYWYKEERNNLFNHIEVVRNDFVSDKFIPKLGTETDYSIYKKITDPDKMISVYAASRNGSESVYLNRRETFWMKAYTTKVDDPEYKIFSFDNAAKADYCYCLINSSLFWWYWICTSDCWHVSKELNCFMTPGIPNDIKATELANALRKRLEDTKAYVGTKQTEYEYKHRECLKEIHAIDDYINSLYGLTAEENRYIKKYALRYRTSGGASK